MTIVKLSDTKKYIYNLAQELRANIINNSPAIFSEPLNFDPHENLKKVLHLITNLTNVRGEFYKIYFDEDMGNGAPAGNNLLLDIIAQSANCGSKLYASMLFRLVIQDAKNKLTQQEMQEFISFRFSGTQKDGSYDNTPLTLAIKTGLTQEAISLIRLGADVNQACENYGGFTPIELAVARYTYSKNIEDLHLFKELISHGARLDKEDIFGHDACSFSQNPIHKDFFDILNPISKEKHFTNIAELCESESKILFLELLDSNLKLDHQLKPVLSQEDFHLYCPQSGNENLSEESYVSSDELILLGLE
jgi:hypothetical protein